MSGGGFFRGTSADQDTRFSNKMKKLLKSQKFAPELDIAIDTSKVQMDVIKPWVATRATELLGFEDEVLINFIYGMLEEKIVDGKHVQIQLTGFMEKNTGKFMKELWSLLISAQSNVSGIPQQFLDQKAEETRLKKIESERIASELQRKRELDKLAEEERQREKEAAAEAARVARGIKGSAENDRDSRLSDDRRTGRGNGNFRRSVSKGRSPPGRSYRRRQRSRHSSDSSLSRSPVRTPPRRRAYSRSPSRSPRRRRRSLSPDRPSRAPRVVHSTVRRSFSRSPIRRRKSPPTYRSPVRRRYSSRSPPARRSSSYSLSPVPRSRARSPYRRNGADERKDYRNTDRVDRPVVRDRRTSASPGFRGSESPQKPPVSSRRPSGFGDREIPRETEGRRVGTDRDGKGSMGGKRGFGEKDERKTGAPPREAKDVEEKRLYSDLEDRKVGPDRAFRDKKDKWAHSDLNDEEEDLQRGGRGVVGEKRLYSDLETRRTGSDRSVRDSKEKWDHNESNEGLKETSRPVTGSPGERRPQSEIERNTGVGRNNLGEDRYFNDNDRRVEDRLEKDGFNGKRETVTRKSTVEKEDRYLSDRRDRHTGRQRSPPSERQQAVKDTRGVRKTGELSQSPVRERRREDYGRRPLELDNDDSDTVRENLPKKSRIQEVEDGGVVREDDQDSLSSRGSEEKRKEEKRLRKEEKRLRREERHKRKREEKQKRKEEKRALKAGTINGEDKRDSPEGMQHSDEEHSEYDQKQLEDALRHKALESLLAKKADLDHIRNLINLEKGLKCRRFKSGTVAAWIGYTARTYPLIARQPSAGHLQLFLHLFCWLLGFAHFEIRLRLLRLSFNGSFLHYGVIDYQYDRRIRITRGLASCFVQYNMQSCLPVPTHDCVLAPVLLAPPAVHRHQLWLPMSSLVTETSLVESTSTSLPAMAAPSPVQSSRNLRGFLRWMRDNNVEYSAGLSFHIGDSVADIGVKARVDLHEGEMIATIPKQACLTIITSEAETMISEAELGGGLGLVVALMYERSLGELSKWDGYLRLVPFQQCLPIVWSLPDIDRLLTGTELHKVIKEDKRLMKSDWKECYGILVDLFGESKFPTKWFSFEHYLAAKTLVASRAFQVDDVHGYGMVPLADLFNHKTGAEDVHFTSVFSDSDSDSEEPVPSTPDSADETFEEAPKRGRKFTSSVDERNNLKEATKEMGKSNNGIIRSPKPKEATKRKGKSNIGVDDSPKRKRRGKCNPTVDESPEICKEAIVKRDESALAESPKLKEVAYKRKSEPNLTEEEAEPAKEGDSGAEEDDAVGLPLNWEESSEVLEMIMVKDVAKGTEIYNTYGLLSNAALLHRYGFTEPDNPFDIVNVDLALVIHVCGRLSSKRHVRRCLTLWRQAGCAPCSSQGTEYFEFSVDGKPQSELLLLLYLIHAPDATRDNVEQQALHWKADEAEFSDDEEIERASSAVVDKLAKALGWTTKLKNSSSRKRSRDGQANGTPNRSNTRRMTPQRTSVLPRKEDSSCLTDFDKWLLTKSVCSSLLAIVAERDSIYPEVRSMTSEKLGSGSRSSTLQDDRELLKTRDRDIDPMLYHALSLRIGERTILDKCATLMKIKSKKR